MSTALVSAIVPTYNRAYCVTRAIDSVLAQTCSEVEVLVIDDGSTDDTADVIRERYGEEPRVRYIYQKNGGVSAARNTGLRHARGDFLALCDSDDYWHPWKLAAQVAALDQFPDVGLVWTEFEAVDPSGRVIDPRHLKNMYAGYRHFGEEDLFTSRYPMRTLAPHLAGPLDQATFYVGNVFSHMLVGGLAPTSTCIFRRERVLKVGLFNTSIHIVEDLEFLLRTAREGAVGYIDAPSMQYQKGMADQLTCAENKLDAALNHLQVIQPFLEYDRDRIQLSDQQIRHLLADVHRWIGEKAFDAGKRTLAREHLRKSLGLNWRQRRSLGMFLTTCLPSFLGKTLRNSYRACKAGFAPRKTVPGALRLLGDR
jgi:glycosyltransferase involved in cell wall biosynthesis